MIPQTTDLDSVLILFQRHPKSDLAFEALPVLDLFFCWDDPEMLEKLAANLDRSPRTELSSAVLGIVQDSQDAESHYPSPMSIGIQN